MLSLAKKRCYCQIALRACPFTLRTYANPWEILGKLFTFPIHTQFNCGFSFFLFIFLLFSSFFWVFFVLITQLAKPQTKRVWGIPLKIASWEGQVYKMASHYAKCGGVAGGRRKEGRKKRQCGKDEAKAGGEGRLVSFGLCRSEWNLLSASAVHKHVRTNTHTHAHKGTHTHTHTAFAALSRDAAQ